MGWDGTGGFDRIHNWQQDQANAVKILPDRHDQEDDNLAAGFVNCMPRDGQAAATGNQNMGGNKIINLATPTNDAEGATKKYVDDAITSAIGSIEGVPLGAIIPFGSVDNIPASYILCDGAAVNRTTYAALFAVIGTNFGVGDGTTTFNLPDLVDKHAEGKSAEVNVGAALAAEVGTHDHTAVTSVDGHTHSIPSHTHSINHDHAAFDTAAGGSHGHIITGQNYSGSLYLERGKGISTGTYSGSDALNTGYGVGGAPDSYYANPNVNGVDSAHTHNINVPAFTGNSGSGGSGNTGTTTPNANTTVAQHTGTNRPASTGVAYIIKAQ